MKIIQLQEWNGWLIGLDDDGHLYRYEHTSDLAGPDPTYLPLFVGWKPLPWALDAVTPVEAG